MTLCPSRKLVFPKVPKRLFDWPPEMPVTLFDYDPSRGQAVPQRLLEGFKGYPQTDGYDGGSYPGQADTCWLLGARTKKIQRSRESAGGKQKKGKTHRGLALIQHLYKIKKHARPLTAIERAAYRTQHAQPVLDKLCDWLD